MRPEEAYIDSITFNSGSTIELEPDSIVVFVGPNNAGKSQAIRDIYGLIGDAGNSVVVKDVSVRLPSKESFTSLLDKIAIYGVDGGQRYNGFGFYD